MQQEFLYRFRITSSLWISSSMIKKLFVYWILIMAKSLFWSRKRSTVTFIFQVWEKLILPSKFLQNKKGIWGIWKTNVLVVILLINYDTKTLTHWFVTWICFVQQKSQTESFIKELGNATKQCILSRFCFMYICHETSMTFCCQFLCTYIDSVGSRLLYATNSIGISQRQNKRTVHIQHSSCTLINSIQELRISFHFYVYVSVCVICVLF